MEKLIDSHISSSLKEYTFSDFPIPIERSRYDECREFVIKEMAALSEVKAIYSMGNVSAPGISDLDFLIVVSSSFKQLEALQSIFQNLPNDFQYIAFCHYPYVAFEETISHSLEILPLSNMKLVYGKDYELDRLEVSNGTHLSVLAELVLLFYPNLFLDTLLLKNIKVRKCIQQLNSMSFPIEFARKNGYNTPGFQIYLDKLKSLKSNCFIWSTEEVNLVVIQLMKFAIIQSYSLIDFILKGVLKGRDNAKSTYSIHLNAFFVNDYSAERSFEQSMKFFKRTKKTAKFLPYAFHDVFCNMINYERNIERELLVDKNFVNLDNRASLYEEYEDCLVRAKMKQMVPYPYIFRLIESSSLKKKIIYQAYSIFAV